jgi:hypothetical protein
MSKRELCPSFVVHGSLPDYPDRRGFVPQELNHWVIESSGHWKMGNFGFVLQNCIAQRGIPRQTATPSMLIHREHGEHKEHREDVRECPLGVLCVLCVLCVLGGSLVLRGSNSYRSSTYSEALRESDSIGATFDPGVSNLQYF